MKETEQDILSLDGWAGAVLSERRAALISALREELHGRDEVREIAIELGPPGREYDLTVAVETDVGWLRTPLWSHARAAMFADSSIHPANREQFAPRVEVAAAAERLSRRLAVAYRLESRGLTFMLDHEPKVQRTWTAEHSPFRRRTSVSREDLIQNAGDVDVRDLLAHFYTGPSIRLVSDAGDAFILPAASEVEGSLVTLCQSCRTWEFEAASVCGSCGGDRVEVVTAARPPRRGGRGE